MVPYATDSDFTCGKSMEPAFSLCALVIGRRTDPAMARYVSPFPSCFPSHAGGEAFTLFSCTVRRLFCRRRSTTCRRRRRL